MRRKKVTTDGEVDFVWDQVNVLSETDAGGATQAQYTGNPGQWGGLVSVRRSDVSSFYGTDLQSGVRMLLSQAAAVTDQYLYRAFGEELWTSGSTTNPYRYAGTYGYYRDLAARLYVRARHLETEGGRWISRDILTLVKRYLYVLQSPVRLVDPSGWLPRAHACSCMVIGIMGNFEAEGQGTLIERVIGILSRRGYNTKLFRSSIPFLDTYLPYGHIYVWLTKYLKKNPNPKPCLCMALYSWGGGQGMKIAQAFEGQIDLKAGVTVDAINVKPAPIDIEHSAVTTTLDGVREQANFYAQNPWTTILDLQPWDIKGGSIPGSWPDRMKRLTNHVSIQDVVNFDWEIASFLGWRCLTS